MPSFVLLNQNTTRICNKIELVEQTQHYQCSSSFVLHTLSAGMAGLSANAS